MVSALAAVLNIPLDLSRDMGPSLVISVEGREVLESRQALLILEKSYNSTCVEPVFFFNRTGTFAGFSLCLKYARVRMTVQLICGSHICELNSPIFTLQRLFPFAGTTLSSKGKTNFFSFLCNQVFGSPVMPSFRI